MPEKIKRWPPRKSVPRVPIENLPQDAIVEYWQWTTARGWYLARSTDRPVSLREAIAERRTHEVSIWKCSGHPVYGSADADAIEAFRAGADPILTMEISNLPEIVCVYTTLCR